MFLKYVCVVPTKPKNTKRMTDAMASVLVQGRGPQNLQVEDGKEFYNVTSEALMQWYGINMYSTSGNLKASICERFNRTLKRKM